MSTENSERSLKSQNMKWLVMLAGLDVLAVLLFVAPEFIDDAAWTTVAVMRGLVPTLLPVLVLLLTGVLSHATKARLVFWTLKDPYPGCQAFTKHGPSDARIDMAALKAQVGDFPTEPSEQNKKWFKLYKLVQGDQAVAEAHKLYLMYRDMSAMTLPLIVLAPIALHLAGVSTVALWSASGFFAAQFVVCCFGARNSGARFVCNVLAVHSTMSPGQVQGKGRPA